MKSIGPMNNKEEREKEAKEAEEAVDQLKTRHLQPMQSLQSWMKLPDENKYLIQPTYLPTPGDPDLFMLKVAPGMERKLVLSLTNKWLAKRKEGQPIKILSVTDSGFKGYIYVEAFREGAVYQAINGIRGINKNKVILVPKNEMVDVFNQKPTQVQLKKGTWIRIKNGIYGGDLGQVYQIDDYNSKPLIRVIPRLDDGAAYTQGKRGMGMKNSRPPQKLFNKEEYNGVEKRHNPIFSKMFYTYNNMQFKNGFLYKQFPITNLLTKDINPTLEEIQKFEREGVRDEASSESESEGGLVDMLQTHKLQLSKDEKVRVISGDLINLKGRVTSIKDDQVSVMPDIREIKECIEFNILDLAKHFEEGDHVSMVSGRHKGQSGHIIIQKDTNILTIFLDTTQKEVDVFSYDCKLAKGQATSVVDSFGYNIGDVVIFNTTCIGMVLVTQLSTLNIMDIHGNVLNVQFKDINSKKLLQKTENTDSRGNLISRNDKVRVLTGVRKGRTGSIKQIFKNFCFLYNKDFIQKNYGYFVEKTENVWIMGSELLEAAQYSAVQNTGQSSFLSGKDDLKRKMIRIIGGNWKGYQGIVLEIYDQKARIELSSKSKIITVERELIQDVAVKEEYGAAVSGSQTPGYGSKTPGYYPQSPAIWQQNDAGSWGQ